MIYRWLVWFYSLVFSGSFFWNKHITPDKRESASQPLRNRIPFSLKTIFFSLISAFLNLFNLKKRCTFRPCTNYSGQYFSISIRFERNELKNSSALCKLTSILTLLFRFIDSDRLLVNISIPFTSSVSLTLKAYGCQSLFYNFLIFF